MRRVALFVTTLGLLAANVTSATRAPAETIWDKAKAARPELLSPDEVHRKVATLYFQAISTKVDDPLFGGQAQVVLEGALAILVRHEARTSADPRLRYDLGLVLARLRRYVDASAALESALSLSPAHPFAEEGAFELALCYSHLGRHAEEERAYELALAATDRPSHKAIVSSNLAESRMAQGKLAAGIEAAEAAIALEPDLATAHLNLAILHDRASDPAAALAAAKVAVALDPTGDVLDGDGVFYEPAYERHWYRALRALALADAEVGDARKSALLGALGGYLQWLALADPADRYRARATENVARIEKVLGLKSPGKK